ncbi:profilin [Phlyctochytrium arcticum]|nr:profilin [Phlyctochytrium arcticum]
MNSLLDEALLSTKHISHAAILRAKDGIVKARSPSFILDMMDWERIQGAFENHREARMQDAGITLMNVPYRVVRADKMAVYGKNNKLGIIIARTNQYYILGTYDAGMYASIAAEAVEKLGKYQKTCHHKQN